jgi:uncharacterized membrane protein
MTEEATRTEPRRLPLWQAGLACAVLTAVYAAISFQQYRRMQSFVFDLGFVESVVRDYAHGRLPEVSLTDGTTAALHFSPALALLAPLVLLVSSPLTILFAQAVAVALGVVPLMRAAGRGWVAWVVAAGYGLAPGFAGLIGFDFHEVALAVPLIAFSMAAMLRGDHRAAVLWALPLILVKEDLGLTIAAVGVVVFLRGSRRWGAFAMVFGVAMFLVVVTWVLPAVNADAGGFAEKYAPADPGDALRILGEGLPSKGRTLVFLLLPTGLLALRSPMLLLVTLPTYAWRFLSERQTYWDPWYQYDAVLVPVAVAAMIEGARMRHGRGSLVVRNVALAGAVVGALVLLPQMPRDHPWDADFWKTPPRTAAVDRLLDTIPSGSRVAASDNLGARIALRTDLYLLGDTLAPDGPALPPSAYDEVDWLAIDRTTYAWQTPAWKGFDALLFTGDFEVVAEADGVVVAHRRDTE